MDFKRLFESYYLTIKGSIKNGIVTEDEVLLPVIHYQKKINAFSAPGEQNLWIVPGLDPAPNPKHYEIAPGKLIIHEEWIDFFSRGLIPIDLSELDHDLAHLMTYAKNPLYTKKLISWYRSNQGLFPLSISTAVMIDETGQRISKDQFGFFSSNFPSRAQLENLGINDLISLAGSLVKNKFSILEAHGGIPNQLNSYPALCTTSAFQVWITKTLASTSPTATLSEWKGESLSLANFLDQIQITLKSTFRQNKDFSYKEWNRLLRNQIIRFYDAYDFYYRNGMSPETMMDDITAEGIKAESLTHRYFEFLIPPHKLQDYIDPRLQTTDP